MLNGNHLSILDVIRRGSHVTHGHTVGGDSPTYISWQAMLSRVRYPNRDRNNMWATKGVKVSDAWLKFENFLADMGERPYGKTLDRFPNGDGNYEPGNCRWATPREQARNTKHTILTFGLAVEIAVARLGGVKCKDLAEQYGISESLPREIVKGRCWPDALAAAKLQLGINLGCPWCGFDDFSLPAQNITTSRFHIGCENADCNVQPHVSGSTISEAWARWNTRSAV